MKHDHGHEGCSLCRIEFSDVGVTAGGDTLLTDINFHIHCGQLTALVGPNGAGKTTLIRALLCAGYSALLITPGVFLLRPLMRKRTRERKNQDLIEEERI